MHAQTMTSNMCLVETIEHCVVSVGLSSLCDDRLWGVRCDSRYTTFHTHGNQTATEKRNRTPVSPPRPPSSPAAPRSRSSRDQRQDRAASALSGCVGGACIFHLCTLYPVNHVKYPDSHSSAGRDLRCTHALAATARTRNIRCNTLQLHKYVDFDDNTSTTRSRSRTCTFLGTPTRHMTNETTDPNGLRPQTQWGVAHASKATDVPRGERRRAGIGIVALQTIF